jgi:exonuclease V
MAGFDMDSDTDYGYDLTTSDEEELLAIVDRLSSSAPQPRSDPLTPSARASQKFNARNPAQSSVHLTTSTNSVPDADASFAIEEAIAALSDDDLSVDTSDLDGRNPDHVDDITRSSATKGQDRRRLAPSVSPDRDELASFVHKTKPRSAPTLLSGPEIRYPDRKFVCRSRLGGIRYHSPLTESD